MSQPPSCPQCATPMAPGQQLPFMGGARVWMCVACQVVQPRDEPRQAHRGRREQKPL